MPVNLFEASEHFSHATFTHELCARKRERERYCNLAYQNVYSKKKACEKKEEGRKNLNPFMKSIQVENFRAFFSGNLK